MLGGMKAGTVVVVVDAEWLVVGVVVELDES